MDPIDRAQQRDEELRIDALRRHNAAMAADVARPPSSDCERCGSEIDPRRREALPRTRTCIVCALKAEHRQGGRRR